MLKHTILFLLAAGMALNATSAQAQATGTPGPGWCGTATEQERYFAEHPGSKAALQANYRRLAALPAPQLRGAAAAPDVTLPVVVHVIHSGGSNNISDQQINSALELLNADYQKLNPDTISTIPLFQPIAASIGFRFRLAQKDPNGNCTTGITRHYAPNLVNDNSSGAVQAVSNWDRSRYLNIWVVGSIGASSGGGIVVGYVSPPVDPSNPRDGFVIRNDFFGNIGTSNSSRAATRAATHEIGHSFGLLHPWGDGNNPGVPGNCNDTDYVADTPPTNGSFSCNLSYAPCGPVANVQNFMDYASCATMFTQGQRALMRNVLASIRTNLTTPANLVATGTNDSYVSPVCPPVVAFSIATGSSATVCVNRPVMLRDYSYAAATSGTLAHNWTFPGGTPATATGPVVTVSYATAGFYPVTETVTNSAGSTTSTVANFIKVEGPTGAETAPFAESFENAAFPNLYAAPTLRNYEVSGTTSTGVVAPYRWQRQTSFPAADGSAYLYVFNRLYPAGAVSTLITPNISLAGVSGAAVLSFARAYALRTASSNDQLQISFSTTCGQNWSAPVVLDAAALSTKGLTPVDGFMPATSADWSTLTVPVPAQYQGSGLFKVRLQMVNGSPAGNNFYFDNLRVSALLTTKVGALAERGISVYPNPLTHETAVHLVLTGPTQVQLRVTDVLGRTVLSLPAKVHGAGNQTIIVNPTGHTLPKGLYVVRILLDGQPFSTKLTVE